MASHPSGSASDSPADHSSDAPAATSSHLPKRSPPGSPPSPRRQNTVLPPIATIQSEADVDSSRNPPQQPPPRTSSASSQPRQTPQHNYHPPLSSTAPHPPTTTMHPQFNSGMNGSSHHQPYYPSQSPQQQQAMMPPGYNPQTQGSSPRSNVHNTAPQTFSYSQQLPPSQQSHPPQGPPYTTYTQYTQPHLPLPHQFPTSSGSSIPPTPQSGSDSPVSPTGGSNANTAKRKRKSTDGPKTKHEKDSDGDGAQDSPLSGSAAAAAAAAADKHKRTKTQRACDPCRRKKIRCDIVPDSEPQICQHCRQYGFECTFFLPITETRFKKRKMEQDMAAAQAQSSRPPESVTRNGSSGGPSNSDRKIAHHPTESETARPSMEHVDNGPKGEVKIYGPTSLSYIVHSIPSLGGARGLDSFDLRHNTTWEVGKSGDGFIQIHEPISSSSQSSSRSIEPRMEREVLERLVNSYFKSIAPIFPVVIESEFLSGPSPPLVLLYAICCVAATARDVPLRVFDSLRMATNALLKSEDVLSTASMVNVQVLLVLGMCEDVYSKAVPKASSAAWLRVSTAIRMAQDLGLHRAEAVKSDVELRRRLWAACVISDRWFALTFGHPFMIDVLDCDARLPTPEDPNAPDTLITRPYLFLGEMVKLSILLGKVLKTIYSPTGLVHATDEIIENLLGELDYWKNHLPDALVYRGVDSIQPAGLLHLFYSCVCMIFWRVFMRITYRCPTHLKFSLTVERWTALVQSSRQSIDWLDKHERLYESWVLVAYAITSCALVQYNTWARRKDADAAVSLRQLRDCVKRWELAIEPNHMNSRRKTTEIICLLYEATQTQGASANEPNALNPTRGVQRHLPDSYQRVDFIKDPSRPGGGVFVASEKMASKLQDLPEGTLLIKEGKDNEELDGTQPMLVDMTPLGSAGRTNSGLTNVNPTIATAKTQPGVQVMNMLDEPASLHAFEQFANVDTGLLEGIPGSMFDWDQWETFFSRFSLPNDPHALHAFAADGAMSGHPQMQQHRPYPHPPPYGGPGPSHPSGS